MKAKRIIILTLILAFFLYTTAQAGIFDFIKYKKVKLSTGATVLVHRFSDKVKYYWVNNKWVSTSLSPEIERMFQFLYEQTKAPKPLLPKKEKVWIPPGAKEIDQSDNKWMPESGIKRKTIERYRARFPSNNNMSITEIIHKLRIAFPQYSHLSDEELLDTLSRR